MSFNPWPSLIGVNKYYNQKWCDKMQTKKHHGCQILQNPFPSSYTKKPTFSLRFSNLVPSFGFSLLPPATAWPVLGRVLFQGWVWRGTTSQVQDEKSTQLKPPSRQYVDTVTGSYVYRYIDRSWRWKEFEHTSILKTVTCRITISTQTLRLLKFNPYDLDVCTRQSQILGHESSEDCLFGVRTYFVKRKVPYLNNQQYF